MRMAIERGGTVGDGNRWKANTSAGRVLEERQSN